MGGLGVPCQGRRAVGEMEGCEALLESSLVPGGSRARPPAEQVGIKVTATLAGGRGGRRSVCLLPGGCSGSSLSVGCRMGGRSDRGTCRDRAQGLGGPEERGETWQPVWARPPPLMPAPSRAGACPQHRAAVASAPSARGVWATLLGRPEAAAGRQGLHCRRGSENPRVPVS